MVCVCVGGGGTTADAVARACGVKKTVLWSSRPLHPSPPCPRCSNWLQQWCGTNVPSSAASSSTSQASPGPASIIVGSPAVASSPSAAPAAAPAGAPGATGAPGSTGSDATTITGRRLLRQA